MITTLFKSLRQYKKDAYLSMLLSVIEVFCEIVIPLEMASLIDLGIEAGSMSEVGRYCLIILLFALGQLISGVLSVRAAARSSVGFARNLRQDMYDNVQTFAFSNIDRFSTASIVTRLTTDVTNLQNASQMILRVATRSPIMLIFAMVMALRINAEISLVFIVILPVLAAVLLYIMRITHPIMKKVFDTYDILNRDVQENIRGIRVVKSFNREEQQIDKFMDTSDVIYQNFVRGERLIALNTPIMQTAVYTCMLLISWIGARAIVLSAGVGMTTGDLTALFTYAMQILMSLMMLSMVFMMITISATSARRMAEVLSEEADIKEPEHPVMNVADGSISFRDVYFAYSRDAKRNVLWDVDFDIASGETVGILGGTGASKTSLVQLIPRLYDVSGGSVSVGGVDVRDYDLKTLRDAVAMVLQKNELFSGTIRDNLLWGDKDATDEEIRGALDLAQASEFVDSFPMGLDTYIEQGGSNVSGGQKQRLCIARALLKKPKVLILDDSTSAVDTATDAALQEAFRTYIPETTKIIISQRVSSVMHADKIIIMHNGKIDTSGTHEELLNSSPAYRELYESQLKGGAGDEQ